PQTGVSVLERYKSRQAVNTSNSKARIEILNRQYFGMGALGSGSDYSPFIQHLGIPSLNIGYNGEGLGGEYHAIYDSYDHYKRFKDPTFEYGITLAKTAGRVTMRLANADKLPFDFVSVHRTIKGYLKEVMSLTDDMREATEAENRLIAGKWFVYAADPQKPLRAPREKEPVPYLDFSPLQNALASLEQAAKDFADAASLEKIAPEKIRQLNEILYKAEQRLLTPDGLPRRPWYRHTIYSPGYYTGYGVKTLPGVREAIEQRNWEEAREQIRVASDAITAYTGEIRKAMQLIT